MVIFKPAIWSAYVAVSPFLINLALFLDSWSARRRRISLDSNISIQINHPCASLSCYFMSTFLVRCEDRFKTSGGEQGRRLLLEKLSCASSSSFKLILCLRKKSVRLKFRRHVLENIQKYNTIIVGTT